MERLKAIAVLVLLVAAVILAAIQANAGGSQIYPWPTNWSLGGLASWSMPIPASGSALPAVASAAEGDLFMKFDAASGTWFRLTSGAWTTAGGGGGTSGDSASVTAHLASTTDPHGASMTVTGSITIGIGTADTEISRYGTSTLSIASYVMIVPNAATPVAVIGTGTMWYDSNTKKLRVYDGTSWQDCW